MENNKGGSYNCGHSACNSCGSCCGESWHGGKHSLLKKLLWIVIFIFVFCMGSAWGEMKAELRGVRHYSKMFGGGYMMRGDNFEYKFKSLDEKIENEIETAPVN